MTDARRQQLTRLVEARGFLRVTDAAVELGVSDVTIRGDLSVLERRGALVRVHGGAMPVAAFREQSLETTLDRDAAAKAAIGRRAARLLASGQAIYVDAGSTAMALAREIVERRDLHDLVVVTSGLTIALALEPAVPRITVIVTGGTLRPLQHSLVNPFAAPMIASLRLDAAFIGCNGIHPVDGVTNLNLPDAEIKRLAMGASRRSILLADASKLGRTDLAVIAGLSSFERLVTAGPSEHHGALAAAGLVIDDAGLAPEPVGLASDAGLVPAPARLIDDADPAPAARLAAGPADKLGR